MRWYPEPILRILSIKLNLQLVSWEVDRERLSTVTKQLDKVKAEYRKRHEQCKLLKEKLRKYEGVIEVKNKEVSVIQSLRYCVSYQWLDHECR